MSKCYLCETNLLVRRNPDKEDLMCVACDEVVAEMEGTALPHSTEIGTAVLVPDKGVPEGAYYFLPHPSLDRRKKLAEIRAAENEEVKRNYGLRGKGK